MNYPGFNEALNRYHTFRFDALWSAGLLGESV